MSTENYELSIQGRVGGAYVENVLCFQSAGLNSNDTKIAGDNLIAAFRASGESLFLACCPGSYTIDSYTARRAFPKPSVVATKQYQPFAVTGTSGADATGLSVCPSVFLVPPMGTKSGGRVFMPPVAQADVAMNAYASGYVTAIAALFNALIGGLSGSGTSWKLVVFSRKNVSVSLVLDFNLSPRIGFQGRRRKPVGGV